MRLTYQGSKSKDGLTGYVDADWAGDVNDQKSVSGYVFKLANGAISWSLKKQHLENHPLVLAPDYI